jgi:alpha-galactosidase
MQRICLPSRVYFVEEVHQPAAGSRSGATWSHSGTDVTLREEAGFLAVEVHAGDVAASRVMLRWDIPPPADAQFLGDHWERAYGDLAWRGFVPERVMPWYFLFHGQHGTSGWGVRTGAAAFCFWTADPRGISLWIDLRSGSQRVRLGGRTLRAAEIVTGEWAERPFVAAQALCRKMSPAPRLAPGPIYGANDFYYSYCTSTEQTILRDSATLSGLAGTTSNRPFSVIDDNWQSRLCCNDSPWRTMHADFPDMTRLAHEIRQAGCRPGIWIRPLVTHEDFPEAWLLRPSPGFSTGGFVLDPSVPEVLEKVRSDMRTIVGWGYDLVKHDFSTFDILARWGSEMGARLTEGSWKFADPSRTTAEIITGLYRAIREGVGDAVVLGCNTLGHLAAGLFEAQRTGDDVSGRNWERTRRMGINTLAYRIAQQGAFFAADADCVPLTTRLPWELSRQWLTLLASSGTPLFVSAQPEALGAEQKAALREALAQAAQPQPLAEPLDWLRNTCPRSWKINGEVVDFNWNGAGGACPFGMS